MNALKLKAEFEMQVTKDDLDDILFEALNAGGVAEWADRVVAVGGKLESASVNRFHLEERSASTNASAVRGTN